MRFLGPNADATDELATFDQIPDVSALPTFVASGMTADDTFSTSLTTMDLSVDLTAGLWVVEYNLSWSVASSTNVSLRFTFSGVENSAQFMMFRIAGTSGLALSTGHDVNTTYTTSSTTPQTAYIKGNINVTTAGTLGLQMLRTASSLGTLEKSSNLKAFKV